MLVIDEAFANGRVARIELDPGGLGVEAAVGAVGVHREGVQGVLGAECHCAPKGGVAYGGAAAGAAVHLRLRQVVGDEQGR